jgi:hypothetical protein
MMTLLIAIISDTHERVYSNMNNAIYYQLCLLLIDLETLMVFNRSKKQSGYLVFSEYIQDDKGPEWTGRVQSTISKVKASIKQ